MGWVFSLVWPVGMGEIGNEKEGGRKEGGPAVAVPYVQLRPKCESPKKRPKFPLLLLQWVEEGGKREKAVFTSARGREIPSRDWKRGGGWKTAHFVLYNSASPSLPSSL